LVTVNDDDKPGIVEQLSDRIVASGAIWEESRMLRLAGKFAGPLRVSVEADRADSGIAKMDGRREDGGGGHHGGRGLPRD
jgi:glycine cleavage system regulatory protein